MLNHVIEEFHEVLHTVPQRERVNTKTVVQDALQDPTNERNTSDHHRGP